ncbi:di-heme-cytochrome C peroxidase [Arenibaculum pallidiluteum]|uniref:di-heme-cytochrome C peroxidase n=1 Tax=Arenibaculum pallidiluteum TaxID=2812559 RepID=UPI001A977E1D|nr:di-heme-cytochrome C peroxidase [Arenibaculum pallidiluteum]
MDHHVLAMRRVPAPVRRASAILLACAVAACSDALPEAPSLPQYPPPARLVLLEQQWTPEQRRWFHHVSQGTATFGIPYEWFVAVERPEISVLSPGLLRDGDYMAGFGFLASAAGPGINPDGLPIGFARGGEKVNPGDGKAWLNPATGRPMTDIGLTCAACHTGQLDYRGTSIRVEGGPAMIDLGKFRDALGMSIGLTEALPLRFARFADRVLGPGHDEEARQALKTQLAETVARGKQLRALEDAAAPRSVAEGFGRLDALNRIGNEVFALQLGDLANYAPADAPVAFPHLWGTSWFDWVQYNASIEQPMVRNAGEAMGVRALANLTNPGGRLFASTVPVRTLHAIELQIGGQQPGPASGFSGLRAPGWPADILPPIDPVKAARGSGLYQELCAACHGPPPNTAAFWDERRWTQPNQAGERYLRVPVVGLDVIGTDPAQATGLRERRIRAPSHLGLAPDDPGPFPDGTYPFGPALGQVVEKVVTAAYDAESPPVGAAERAVLNGNRPNGIRAPLGYKARPLDGIWATPPYLHNGSVPNLYALLQPAEERPRTFHLGSREFDPVNVGYETGPLEGGFEIITTLPGNRNTGHEFKGPPDAPRERGRIGRGLSHEERMDLIEYLKTL